ncbi:MAG: 50S ribosomal protein L15 [Patescibacteria group bacterium]
MTLGMHNIFSSGKTIDKKKRLGRGDSSGSGNYSGRGQKGQKSRSGASGLKRVGMKQLISQTPKLRGFKSQKEKNQPVNPEAINNNFKEKGEVTPKTLAEAGLVNIKKGPVKILGDGELTVKNLTFSGVKVSKAAREEIEKKGGKILE